MPSLFRCASFALSLAMAGCVSASEASKAGYTCEDDDIDDQHPDGINLGVAGQCDERMLDAKGQPVSGMGAYDYCTYDAGRAGMLQEARCVHDRCVRDPPGVACPAGTVCRAGACVPGKPEDPLCVETDKGGDPFTYGTVSALGHSGSDSCYLSRTLAKADGWLTRACQPGDVVPIDPDVKFCGVYETACNGPDFDDQSFVPCEFGCKDGACLRAKP